MSTGMLDTQSTTYCIVFGMILAYHKTWWTSQKMIPKWHGRVQINAKSKYVHCNRIMYMYIQPRSTKTIAMTNNY